MAPSSGDISGNNVVDSLVKSQVAAALKANTLQRNLSSPSVSASSSTASLLVPTNYRGEVSPGCSLFLAPPAEVTDAFVDAEFQMCHGLIGREFRVDKRGRVAFGFFRSPDFAIAAIEKLQMCSPPLYAEVGERTIPTTHTTASELGEPSHTLRVSHPTRSVQELKEFFVGAGGLEKFEVDPKGVAWVKFTSLKAAVAGAEHLMVMRESGWEDVVASFASNVALTTGEEEAGRERKKKSASSSSSKRSQSPKGRIFSPHKRERHVDTEASNFD